MNQNLLNSKDNESNIVGFFVDHYSNGLQQQTDVIQTNIQAHHNNLDSSYNYTDSFPMINNSISPVNGLDTVTVSSTSQYFSHAPQYNYNTNNADGLSYSINSPNATFNATQPQLNHKFEIPGFEIEMIIRPKSNPIMNLDMQCQLREDKSHSSMNAYYVDGTFANGDSANFVNVMNMDNSQFQFQQQKNS
jgi:hypothetical protein